MNKIGKVGVLVVLGILVLVAFSVSLMAQSWGTTVPENASYRISIDDDNNAGDEVFAVWEGVGGGGGSELFRVQEDGNVGIGTTGPSHKLEIADASTTANRAGLYVAQSGAISGTGYGSYVSKTGASTTNVGGYFSASGATNNYGLIVENGYVGIGTTSPNSELDVRGDADILGYLTADNGHFYVDDTNHRVAIGTSTPARKLDIYDDTDTPQLRLSYGSSVYVDFLLNAGGDLVMTSTSGFVGIGAAPNSALHVEFDNAGANTDLVTFARTSDTPADDDSYNIDFRHEDDSDNLDIFAQIKLIASDVTHTTEDGELAFGITQAGSTSEVMRISDGKVGIGTTSPDRLLHTEISDAGTNSVTYAQRLSHITSDTAAANFGTGIEFELEDAGGNNDIAAAIEAVWSSATGGSEESSLQFKTTDVGDDNLATRMLIDKDGSVGIGTTSPTATVHISHNDAVDAFMVDADDTSFMIDANGNVGLVAVTRPTERLDIGPAVLATGTASQRSSERFALTGSFWTGSAEIKHSFKLQNIASTTSNEEGRFAILWDSSDLVSILSGGNVGIGVTIPDTELQVDGEIKQKVTSSDVSNPPTDAELDTLWTSPATQGDGWTAYLKDSSSNNFYQIVAVGTDWYIFTGVKAT